MTAVRSFAIVPAAGHSKRMGRPKLLLPWRGSTIIEHVLREWTASHVSRVVVVARRHDRRLIAACELFPVEVVCPEVDPRDMKESVQVGLRHCDQHHAATAGDAWLLAPADLPHLSATIINQVLAARELAGDSIVVPNMDQQRGHPVLFPWSLSREVFTLGRNVGVNFLLTQYPTHDLPVEHTGCVMDVDSPSDYEKLISAENTPDSQDRPATDRMDGR